MCTSFGTNSNKQTEKKWRGLPEEVVDPSLRWGIHSEHKGSYARKQGRSLKIQQKDTEADLKVFPLAKFWIIRESKE